MSLDKTMRTQDDLSSIPIIQSPQFDNALFALIATRKIYIVKTHTLAHCRHPAPIVSDRQVSSMCYVHLLHAAQSNFYSSSASDVAVNYSGIIAADTLGAHSLFTALLIYI
eukprot:Tbor_TRINITY_DN5781_c0_g3::TRINITY_DN5781_c0_g3_i1::g.19812::m.19812